MRNSDPDDQPWGSDEPVGLLMGMVLVFMVFMTSGMTLICWAWWLQPTSDGLIQAYVMIIIQWIGCREVGYKDLFRSGFRKSYYLIWLIPAILSTLGLTLGLALGHR